jgi:hypothetical protein
MPIGILFWVLMILWFIFGMWSNGPGHTVLGGWGWLPSAFLLFVLLALLGWHDFGPVIHG